MKFMIVVKATSDSEAGIMPPESVFAEMAAYHERLHQAGKLVDGAGLHPTSKAFRVRYSGGRRSVIDGPFTETKELIAGYTIIRADSVDEARRWALEFPNPTGSDGEIEVRQLFGREDFDISDETAERFRAIDMTGGE